MLAQCRTSIDHKSGVSVIGERIQTEAHLSRNDDGHDEDEVHARPLIVKSAGIGPEVECEDVEDEGYRAERRV